MARRLVRVSYTARSAYFTGTSKGLLVRHAERIGAPWQWIAGADRLTCPAQRGADLEASLVADGYRVELLVTP